MKCYVLIPDGEFECQAALSVRDMLKRHDPGVKVLFFHPDRLGFFRERGCSELKVPHPVPGILRRFPTLARLFLLRQVLRRRQGYKEQIVVFQDRPTLLLWIVLFTRKKPVLINTVQVLDRQYTKLEQLILRLFCRVVLVNDRTLCLALRQLNIPAYFVGNLPADVLKPLDLVFLTGGKTAYTLIPRPAFFFGDLNRLLEAARQIEKKEESYYLLALPEGIKVSSFLQEISEKGWIFQKSLEGDIIEGYLRKERFYTNLTRFLGEAIIQSERVISADAVRVMQAVGWGKRVWFLQQDDEVDRVAQMLTQNHFLESNRSMQNRFGKRGATHRIAGYLLRGVVEDDQLPYGRKNQG